MYAFIVVAFRIINPCQFGKAVLLLNDFRLMLVDIRSQLFKGKLTSII